MVWMLLTPGRDETAHAASEAKTLGARAHVHAGAFAAEPDPRDDELSTEAWILLGDLDTALFQAGIVSVWLETRPRPLVVFAGGMSALDALLAMDGDPLAFRMGWERLRAAHVLAAAALERAPLPAFLRRNGSLEWTRSLAASSRNGTPSLRLLASGGFVDFAAGAAQSAALLDDVLHHRATSHALATAIDGAVAAGARRVLVPGADERTLARREVVRAIEDARADGVEVSLIPMAVSARPGMVGYLLPGLGRADRLMRAGREAARRWAQGTSAAAPVR